MEASIPACTHTAHHWMVEPHATAEGWPATCIHCEATRVFPRQEYSYYGTTRDDGNTKVMARVNTW